MPVWIPNLDVAVETPDSAANVTPGDVIGNKLDTASEAAGTASIVRLLRALIARWGVTAQNSALNVDIADVIGNKLDASYDGGNSIYAILHTLEDHFHSAQLVRPNLGASITVTSGAGAWGYGALSADIVAAASIADPFDIHGIAIDTISANDQFQLAIVQTVAAVDTTVAEVSFVRTNAQTTSLHIPIQTALIPGGAEVRAQLACAGGGAKTVGMKVRLHAY